jgi:T-complex protein 1 subunit gamma
MVLNTNTKRESGKAAQMGNIQAAKAVSDIIRTTLGPRSMLKMLLDPMGGIVMTNDGNCILREVDVSHPAAKSMIELSRAQDEEVGDGTTSVIILSGEILGAAEPLLERNFHPTVIVKGYMMALQRALQVCKDISRTIDIDNMDELQEIVTSTIGTKFSSRWGNMLVDMAIEAVLKVVNRRDDTTTEVDIKRYVRVEKIPGGELADCRVLNGVMFNKDVTHAKMRRKIDNPRVLLLDCPLEYKKGDSQTNVEIMNEDDFNTLLRQEEEYVEQVTTFQRHAAIPSPTAYCFYCHPCHCYFDSHCHLTAPYTFFVLSSPHCPTA